MAHPFRGGGPDEGIAGSPAAEAMGHVPERTRLRPLEIGICGWCIDRHDVVRGLETAAELGLRVVQIGLFGRAAVASADVQKIRRRAEACGIELAGVFVGFDGEDYSSIPQITATGGFMPDANYADRLATTRRAAAVAAALGCRTLAVHAGTVPADAADPVYVKLVAHVREAADAAAESDVRLLLETGRESADALAGFIRSVGRTDIGVNFDPGNFVSYGTDDPVRAIGTLKAGIELTHLKDGAPSSTPGVSFGTKRPLGAGEVQIPRVISKLRAAGYTGPLLLETPAPGSPPADYLAAIEFLRSMLE